MSALEQEIHERVGKLDPERQKQVLEFVRNLDDVDSAPEDWFTKLRLLRAKFDEKYGENYFVNIQSILDEVREERLDDLMGGR